MKSVDSGSQLLRLDTIKIIVMVIIYVNDAYQTENMNVWFIKRKSSSDEFGDFNS